MLRLAQAYSDPTSKGRDIDRLHNHPKERYTLSVKLSDFTV